MRSVYFIAKADFLQRVRSYGFLLTLAVCAVTAYAIVPPAGADYSGVILSGYRGLNNCAWLGGMAAVVASLYLSLLGFYLVNTAVKRDSDTGVGQIVATTRVSNFFYLLGKWLSNLCVLSLMLCVVGIVILVTFFTKGEVGSLEPGQLFLPLLVYAFPPLILISGLAVALECFHWLKRGVVNIFYFFFWTFMLVLPMASIEGADPHTPSVQILDISGLYTIMTDMESDLKTTNPEHQNGNFAVNFPMTDPVSGTFEFRGVRLWGFDWIVRFIWLPVTLLILALAAVAFKRFDPTYQKTRIRREGSYLDKMFRNGKSPTTLPKTDFSTIPSPRCRFNLLHLVRAELKILVNGRSRWWQLVILGLFLATVFSPLDVAHRILLPILWVWPVLILSKLGCRETLHRCQEYVFAAASPLRRQLPAGLLAAWVLLLVLAAPVMV